MKAEQEPRRWAKVLFGLAEADGTVETVDADLESAISTMAGHVKLKQALADPKLPAAKKASIVAEVFGEISPVVTGVLVTLAQEGATSLLPAVHVAYQQISEEARNVSIADVTTAIALDDKPASDLRAKLEMLAGRKVVIHEHVDPTILGGVIVRMGGKVMDGSVRSRLVQLRMQMAGRGSEA
jgi:F-type H+-transporting ATPase subunit delta